MILVTGCAGFIGAGVVRALLARGEAVAGIDNLNDYYDPALKRARLEPCVTAGLRFMRWTWPMRRHWARPSAPSPRGGSCTLPPRPVCATPSKTRRPTSRAT